MTTPHTHADILRAIADGRTIEWQQSSGDWFEEDAAETLNTLSLYPPERWRIKPDTVTLTMEIPAPMKVDPVMGARYWSIDNTGVFGCSWDEDSTDQRAFARGIWPNEEAARAADAARVEAMAKIRNGV